MAEEEKKIDCACAAEEAETVIQDEPMDEPAGIPAEECCEAQPRPEEAETAAVPEADGCGESAGSPHDEMTRTLSELMRKVDSVGEEINRNREALDCLLDKLLCSHGEEKGGASGENAAAELVSKLALVETAVRKNSQTADEIKAEALALHRLYQNDFAGRIRNMETELERYRKRDAGLAFDGIYKEIAQVYVDFEDLGDGVEDKKLARNIRYLLEELEELLLSHGVEMMKSGEGEKRNLSLTQVIDRIPTDDPAMEGLVAKSIASGFYIEKRCLIKEKVNVYRYEAPAQAPEAAEEAADEAAAAEENIPAGQAADNE